MVAFNAHFDGKVLVPEEPVDLPIGQMLIVQIETTPTNLKLTNGRDLLQLAGSLDAELADEMLRAVEQGRGKVDVTNIAPNSHKILEFTGIFDSESLTEMKQAIEEDCERIDHDGW